ncbi:MAG: hypothetical protein ACT4OO_08395 [Nitrospiraceae bacterium]
MGTRAKQSREQAKQDKRREKDVRRTQRKADKQILPVLKDDEDPDLAGIVPGPQSSSRNFDEVHELSAGKARPRL